MRDQFMEIKVKRSCTSVKPFHIFCFKIHFIMSLFSLHQKRIYETVIKVLLVGLVGSLERHFERPQLVGGAGELYL